MARRGYMSAGIPGGHGPRFRGGAKLLGALSVTALVATALIFELAPAAHAGVSLGVSPSFPTPVSAGQANVPASVSIQNTSNAAQAVGNVTVTSITLVPTCGTAPPAGSPDCPAASVDPGVFQISGSGTGAAGSACAGTAFTIAVTDAAQGKVTFTPGTPVVLNGAGATCRINFTFNVLKVPTKDALPDPGLQTVQTAAANGTHADATTGGGIGQSFVTVNAAASGVTTSATPSAPLGSPISDTATVTGAAPTGTVTFTAFGPNDATCTNPPAFTSPPVALAGGVASSGNFTPAQPGAYRWRAAYSGDANNNPVTTPCNAANETSNVQVTDTITTQATSNAPIGSAISDTATLSGGANTPTGTMTFRAFGPADATCANPPAFTSAPVTVNGNGAYASGAFTPNTAGTYRWTVQYTGDSSNAPLTTPCNAANETSAVTAAGPAITTQATPNAALGGAISDTATLTGGQNPGGTIVFRAFGPNDAACANPAAFTSAGVVVNGNGTYNSGPFTPATAGAYRWTATYSGDPNNTGVTTPCNAANETSTVTAASPAITTQASPAVVVGNPITDTATLSGTINPTGNIVFSLFGPNNATCAGPAVFTSTKPVTANGNVTSDPFTPSAPGTYRWIAAYSGGNGNAAVSTACNDANESVQVAQRVPTLTTTASANVPLGGAISDTATLAGGFNPTGTIVFNVFGPNDDTCANPPVFTNSKTVTGNGSYKSDPFTPATPGLYRFVAAYGGDTGNAAVGPTACNDPNETVRVQKTTVNITTKASPSVPLGGAINDTATITGGTNPTGSIIFAAYGPDNDRCSGQDAFAVIVPVNGNGTITSPSFTPTTNGLYRWIVVYSGDRNNEAFLSSCGDPAEAVQVGAVNPPTTTTQPTVPASPSTTTPTTAAPATTTTTKVAGATTTTPPVVTTNPTRSVVGGLSVTGRELGRLARIAFAMTLFGLFAVVVSRRRPQPERARRR